MSIFRLCWTYVLSVELHLLYLLLLLLCDDVDLFICETWYWVLSMVELFVRWDMHDIETTFYSHAQGMIANTNLNLYNVMSPCFCKYFVLYISCLFICGTLSLFVGSSLLCNLFDMHTSRGRCYLCHMIWSFCLQIIVLSSNTKKGEIERTFPKSLIVLCVS